MTRIWIGLADFVSRRTGLVVGLAAAVTVVLALGLPKLDFATGQDSYLNEGEEIAEDNEDYQDLFGGQAMLTLFEADEGKTIVDMFTPANVQQWQDLEEEIKAVEGVDGVVSPLTAMLWTQNLLTPRVPTGEVDADGNPVYEVDENGQPVLALDEEGNPDIEVLVDDEGNPSVDPAAATTSVAGEVLLRARDRETEAGNDEAAQARLDDSLTTLDRVAVAAQGGASFENPEWVEFLLIGNDGRIRPALRPVFQTAPGVDPTLDNAQKASMITRLSGNQSIEEEGSASDAVVAAIEEVEWENGTSLTTGAPVLLKDLNDYLQGGMLTLGGIAVLVMLVVLFIVFRVRWRLLSLGVTLVGIVWVFGLLGFVGFRLSLVTIAGLPVLIGMGIDFSIQNHNRVEEEIVLDRSPSPFAETLRNLGPGLLLAAIAAIVSFTAMQWSAVPMVRDFGVLLSIGIAILLFVGLILPTALLGFRERRSPTTEETEHHFVERIVVWLGSLPRWSAVPLMVIGVVLFGFGILAEDAFEIETDAEKWVNQDTQVIEDLNTLQDKTGSSSELAIFVQTKDGEELFTDEVGQFMTDLGLDNLEADPETLLTATSLATTMAYAMELEEASSLAPTGEDLALGYSVAPPDIQQSIVSEDGRSANLIFRTGPSELDVRRQVVEEIEATIVLPDSIEKATPSGLAVVGIGLLENIERNRTELTYIALGLVAIWLVIRFRSFGKTLLSIVPALLAVGTSALVVAAAGFKLSPLTTISGPLVIATCTEFASLITVRYLEERRRGLVAREATDVAAARTGRAFVASGLTTIGGFGVLVFSALPLLRDFGIIVTLNVTVALLSALVVVPPLIVWADEKGLLKSGGAPSGVGPRPDEAETDEPATVPA